MRENSSSAKISNKLQGFLELDGEEAKGEAKVQRKIEVRRVHGITYKPFNTSSLDFIQCHFSYGGYQWRIYFHEKRFILSLDFVKHVTFGDINLKENTQ